MARNALHRKAKRARENPVDFFELVLRDEATQKHVKVPPHQDVLLDFVTYPAHDKAVVIMPVGTAKTATCAGLGLYLLSKNTSLRGLIASATQQQAMKPLVFIRQAIERSEELRLITDGKLRPSRFRGEPWSDTRITV
jgi:hypothetical protein